jgi:uncharacterized repeat protein (TIGR03833 family)
MLFFDVKESFKSKGISFMTGTDRCAIHPGVRVAMVQKQDQRTGRLTEGVVRDILTKSATHPHGIKVRLTDGTVGRVKGILEGQT